LYRLSLHDALPICAVVAQVEPAADEQRPGRARDVGPGRAGGGRCSHASQASAVTRVDPVSTGDRGPATLAVDCGGGGIKASVLDAAGTMHAQPVRTATPYPLPPERLLDTVRQLAAQLPRADRATVGMPGMI